MTNRFADRSGSRRLKADREAGLGGLGGRRKVEGPRATVVEEEAPPAPPSSSSSSCLTGAEAAPRCWGWLDSRGLALPDWRPEAGAGWRGWRCPPAANAAHAAAAVAAGRLAGWLPPRPKREAAEVAADAVAMLPLDGTVVVLANRRGERQHSWMSRRARLRCIVVSHAAR